MNPQKSRELQLLLIVLLPKEINDTHYKCQRTTTKTKPRIGLNSRKKNAKVNELTRTTRTRTPRQKRGREIGKVSRKKVRKQKAKKKNNKNCEINVRTHVAKKFACSSSSLFFGALSTFSFQSQVEEQLRARVCVCVGVCVGDILCEFSCRSPARSPALSLAIFLIALVRDFYFFFFFLLTQFRMFGKQKRHKNNKK